MESLVVTPKNSTELKFLAELLNKMALKTVKLSDEVKENMGLAYLMSQADRNDNCCVQLTLKTTYYGKNENATF